MQRFKNTLQEIRDLALSFGEEDDDPTIDAPEPGARFRDPEMRCSSSELTPLHNITSLGNQYTARLTAS